MGDTPFKDDTTGVSSQIRRGAQTEKTEYCKQQRLFTAGQISRLMRYQMVSFAQLLPIRPHYQRQVAILRLQKAEQTLQIYLAGR